MNELALREVRAGYGPVEVLHGVDLQVPAGAVTALLGPNGAGKSTLLSVVAGLLPLRGGQVLWGGTDAGRSTATARARAGMTLVPERRGVFPQLSVAENLDIFARSSGSGTREAAFAAFPVLEQRLGQAAGSLSGGEQQMLAMSRALMNAPRLLLLDEISFGLAPRVARQLFGVVAGLAVTGPAVLLVEQHLSAALQLADIVYVLARGEVVFAGEPGELRGRALPGYVSTHGSGARVGGAPGPGAPAKGAQVAG